MRRVVTILFLLVAALSNAQDKGAIRFQPAPGITATGGTLTGPLLLPDGSPTQTSLGFTSATGLGLFRYSATSIGIRGAANGVVDLALRIRAVRTGGFDMSDLGQISWSASEYADGTADVVLRRDAANTLALRNSTNAQTFNIYNSFTTAGSNYGRFSIVASATGTDLIGEGAGATATTAGIRSIQGCRSKAVVDNTATAFVRVAVADDDYEGGTIFWTAYAEDADTDARQTRTGTTSFSILNNSGTEAATFSTGDSSVGVTAGTLTCTFDGNSAVNNTIDLRATCNTSLDANAETLTFEWCLVMPSAATLTVQ